MHLSAHPALRAFRHRNFRVFYAGQFVSVLGTWMQSVATSWLVYRLTGSAFLLGLTAFAQQIPYLLLAPIAGVVADRVDRRRVLLFVQSLALLQAAALAVLTYTDSIQVWQVVALAALLGLLNAFEAPMRQAYLLELIADRNDLPNAIALQGFIMNATRLIGPSIAGILLAFAGEASCFALNALSYVAILAAYAVVRVAPRTIEHATSGLLGGLLEGFRYAFSQLAIRRLLVLLMVMSFFSSPWQPLLPIFAAERFGGDSRTLGFLIGAMGCGAIVATLFLASRPSVRGLGRIIPYTCAAAGAAILAFSLSGSFWIGVFILPIFGFGLIVTVSSSNQILQMIAADTFRGRMVSIYVMSFLGVAPLGSLVAGALAHAIGAHWTLVFNGCCLLLLAAWFAAGLRRWREAVRPLYAKRGVPTRVER